MIFPSSFLLLSFLDPTLSVCAPDEGGGVEVVQLIKVEKRRQVREHLVSYPVPGQTFSTFCKNPLMYPKKIISYILSILNSLFVVCVYNCSTIISCLHTHPSSC